MSLFALAEHIAETIDIGPGTRVFEVDCGDGALLEPFHVNGYVVGGSDEDAEAVDLARAAMPEGTFSVGSAAALDPAVPWHVVICRSLPRQPDPNRVRGVVARMIAKATHAVVLLDVPDELHGAVVRALGEAGATAVQVEGRDIFARV